MPLFKSPEDRMQSGNDKLLRRDFAGARDDFQSAAEGFAKRGQGPGAQLAQAYVAVLGLAGKPGAAEYARAVQALAPLGPTPLKLGPRTPSAADVAREADLARQEAEIMSARPQTAEAHRAAGQALQQLSLAYRQLGDQFLVLPELFQHGTVPAASKAPALAALAEEELGESEVVANPKRAAEHNQNARNWWMQVGETSRADAAGQRVGRYGRAVRCWFCGRETTGEGINFRMLPSDIAGFPATASGSALPANDPGSNSIFACRPCGATVEKIADQRAQMKAAEMEARINRMLQAMRARAGVAGQWIPTELPP